MEKQNEKVVISNYEGFVELCKEIGLLGKHEPYVLLPQGHIPVKEIRGKDIIGGANLPMFIKCICRKQTIVNLQIADELKGKKLTIEEYLKCLRSVEVFATIKLDKQLYVNENLVSSCTIGD